MLFMPRSLLKEYIVKRKLSEYLRLLLMQVFKSTFGDEDDVKDLTAITCDLIFLALPHGQSAEIVRQINEKVKIVDLGADFRLKSEQAWKQYYNDSYAGAWATD